jgi:hypothetical protein
MAQEPLLITRNDLVKYTVINGNVDSDKFLQFIKIAQDIHIQNYLGTDLFNRLKNDVATAVSGFGAVTSFTIVNGGTSYSSGTNEPSTSPNGNGATFDITEVAGVVTQAVINQSGQGYIVGDIITLTSGGGDCTISVDAIDEIPEPYRNLLNYYVKPMLIHWAMYEYLPFSAYTIANKGVFKHNSENSTNAEKSEIDLLVSKQMDIAEQYTNRFLDHMGFNANLYPEYRSNSNGDVYPSTNNNFSGWYL